MASKKYTKGKDGYYQARVWDGTYIKGVKHRITLRSKKSSKDLEKKVQEFELEVRERKNVRRTEISFLDYARSWAKLYKAGAANNTKEMYNNIIEKHFRLLENVKLQDIDRRHLQLVIVEAEGKKRTQQQIRMVFKEVLESAVSDQLFPANVAESIFSSVDTIAYKPEEKRPLTESERKAVFKADFNESDKVFTYILYGCGLRRGEALALTIFDIDLKKKEITVSKSHELIRGSVGQKDPKSGNGFRTVPIPDKIYPVIREYIQELRSTGKTYLFTMRNGKPVTKSSYRRMWERIIKAMQAVSDEPIEGLTAHIFRHNYCTMLCYQIPSISIKHIAYLMGDTEKVVLDVYNHIVMEKEDAESAVNAALI